jgi:hypothetical protein
VHRSVAKFEPVLLTFTLGAACLRPNPAYDDQPTAMASTSGPSGTVTTFDSAPTTSGDATVQSTITTGGEVTTDGVTTSTSSATGVIDGSSSGTTTGEALDCWGPATPWEIQELLDAQLGALPSSPRISPDGLVLHYMAGLQGAKRPHRSQRASRGEAFTSGWQVVPWPGLPFGIDHPNFLRDETEIVLAGRPGMQDEIFMATFDGNGWTSPMPMAGPVNTEVHESIATFTADATRMVFQRNDGPKNPYAGDTWNFYEATRAADAPLGAPFGAPVQVILPTFSNDAQFAHVNLCPTVSPDGLHLFFGSSYPLVLDADNAKDALGVFYTRRDAPSGPWQVPVEHLDLRAATWETCPSSVTADGCTLVFHRFKFMEEPGDYRIYFAVRSPL